MTSNQINYQNMMERARNDRAIEDETNRHNMAVEAYNAGLLANQQYANAETKRHNMAMEQLQQTQTVLNQMQIEYQKAYNERYLDVQRYRAAEEARTNQANELIRTEANRLTGERDTHNWEVARVQNQLRLQELEEQQRANQAREEENKRHNIATETNNYIQTGTNAAQSFFNMVLQGMKLGVS